MNRLPKVPEELLLMGNDLEGRTNEVRTFLDRRLSFAEAKE